METLDLHGVRHAEAKILIEDFLALNELPLRIITGQSLAMQEIVKELLSSEMKWQYESDWNLGSMIILECS